jgi:hypothetical protein
MTKHEAATREVANLIQGAGVKGNLVTIPNCVPARQVVSTGKPNKSFRNLTSEDADAR